MKMDSSYESIARLLKRAADLKAQISTSQQGGPSNANQSTGWNELELLTPQSKGYDLAWQWQGIQGLTDTLQGQAELLKASKSGLSNVWKTILDDTTSKSGQKTKLYLASMHPMLVEALIRGDITRRLYEDDPLFSDAIHSAELDEWPGTYINILCRRQRPQGPQGGQHRPDNSHLSPWPGYGLCVSELEGVLQDCALYLRVGDPASDILAENVDSFFCEDKSARSETAERLNRRFLFSDRSVEVITEWIEAVRTQIMQPAGNHLAGRPMQRCFYEIGIGDHHHEYVDGSNYLFGLVESAVHRRCPDIFEVRAYQLHRILETDDQSLSEVELILLGRAHYTQCGLNVRHGGDQVRGFEKLPQDALERNLQRLRRDRRFEQSWQHDSEKFAAFVAACEAAGQLDNYRKEVQALEAEALVEASEEMEQASRAVDVDRAKKAVLEAIQKWLPDPRPETSGQGLTEVEETPSPVSRMALKVATKATSCERTCSIAEVDDDARPTKRPRQKSPSLEL